MPLIIQHSLHLTLSLSEIEREANIARNRILLEQLELKQAVEDIGIPKPKAKPTAKPVGNAKRKREVSEPELPRRQSARLRGAIDPDESPEKRRKREVCHIYMSKWINNTDRTTGGT